jgi:flagellar biosynthesis protein
MPTPDKPRRATALHYAGEGAPTVVASGRDLVADRIVEVAQKAGVPVRKDAALASALAGLELERAIPEDLYLAVAETLAWAYALDVGASRGSRGAR